MREVSFKFMYVFLAMSVSSSIMQLDLIPVEMGGKVPIYLNVTE